MFLVPQLKNFIYELCGARSTCKAKIRLLQTYTGVLQKKKLYVHCFQGNPHKLFNKQIPCSHASVQFSNTSQNLPILLSGQFLSSEQRCEPKSLDVTLNIAGVERIHSGNTH